MDLGVTVASGHVTEPPLVRRGFARAATPRWCQCCTPTSASAAPIGIPWPSDPPSTFGAIAVQLRSPGRLTLSRIMILAIRTRRCVLRNAKRTSCRTLFNPLRGPSPLTMPRARRLALAEMLQGARRTVVVLCRSHLMRREARGRTLRECACSLCAQRLEPRSAKGNGHQRLSATAAARAYLQKVLRARKRHEITVAPRPGITSPRCRGRCNPVARADRCRPPDMSGGQHGPRFLTDWELRGRAFSTGIHVLRV